MTDHDDTDIAHDVGALVEATVDGIHTAAQAQGKCVSCVCMETVHLLLANFMVASDMVNTEGSVTDPVAFAEILQHVANGSTRVAGQLAALSADNPTEDPDTTIH